MLTARLASETAVGLEGGVENSSLGCSSSNFVKVTNTLIVGTTGIATWVIVMNNDDEVSKTTVRIAEWV